MVDEKWQNSTGTDIAHYKYVYDGKGNIVRSIDILSKKEYNYEYEDGRIVRATESNITVTNEIVTSKVIVNTIKYYYDTEGKMTKKVIAPANGTEQTIYYETNNDNTVVKFSSGGKTVTSHAKTDSFGRKTFDELQLGTGFVSRQFHYHPGNVTDAHVANEKLKSSATTQLVSRIVLSGGRTLSYEYDAEERITKVTDSVDGTTEYTYDALGQLLTETKNGIMINTMAYDNYGNIVKKNGKAYTYGDTTWKDLLTGFDGKTITYDAQGNPTSYLGHTLTWEKGRQLKKFDNIEYTYNANGIRTSKKVNGVLHTYTLDGTKILREAWGNNTLIPLYDNEDNVCGILYNDTPYYFVKNLQGDVISIVNKDAQTVARYSYDAWGVCTVTQNSAGIATINPFRYRGYYYDEEIGLYYLQSRYYDASVGRFINSDSRLGINLGIWAHALYCYCGNAPVFRVDASGYAWWNVFVKVVTIIASVVTVAHIVNAGFALSQADYNKSHDVKTIVSDQDNVDMKLGCKTFAAMGCGAAATHNAIILAGGSSSLADVVEFMQAHDLTLGFAGVYFTNIQLYLRRKGYSNEIHFIRLKDNIDRKIKNCKRKIAILAYKHSSGGHYVAIKYSDSDKQFHVYNSNQNLSSVDTWIKDHSYSPLSLITLK